MISLDSINVGEYIVAKLLSPSKKIAGQVTRNYKGLATVECHTLQGTSDQYEFRDDTGVVLANLGETPMSGSLYGATVRVLHEQAESPRWGTISFFRELDDDEKGLLKGALKTSWARLKSMKLDTAIQLNYLSILEPKGKYAGMYKSNKDGSGILLHPKSFDADSVQIIMDHEVAHAIWFQTLSDSQKAQWVLLYEKYVVVSREQYEELESVLSYIRKHPMTLESYELYYSEDETALSILERIVGGLLALKFHDREEVDLFLQFCTDKSVRTSSIKEAWDQSTGVTSEMDESPITDYAMLNVKEMFAEAYCHHVNGTIKLPEDVLEVLHATIPVRKIKG